MWIALVASWRDRDRLERKEREFESRFRFAFRPWGPMLVRSLRLSPERSWNWVILPLPLSLPLLLSLSEVCKSDQIVYP